MNFRTTNMIPPADRLNRTATKDTTNATIRTNKINSKPVLHPEFQEASEYTNDEYWKNLLFLASRGNFNGKNISYDGKHMIKKDAFIKCRMPSDPKDLATAFINFHKQYNRTFSTTDTEQQCAAQRAYSSQIILLQWATCSKNMKKSRLVLYAKTLAEETEVTNVDKTITQFDLADILLTALNNGMLANGVTMENNVITKIDCLKYNKTTNKWWVDPKISKPVVKKASKRSTKKEPASIMEGWEMILKTYSGT